LLLHYGYRQRQARALLWLGLPLVLVLVWVAGSFALYRHYYPLPTGSPGYRFQTLSGQQQQLSALLAQRKADFTVVNLWASWCPPCSAEMPLLMQSQAEYPQGQFILLNQGETAAEVTQFLQQHQLQFQQVWLDPNRQFGRWLGQQALPLTLIYDQHGNLVDGHAGVLSKAQLAAKLAPFRVGASPASNSNPR
jgi:thiol-disulfide isomerase/thioredoxin